MSGRTTSSHGLPTIPSAQIRVRVVRPLVEIVRRSMQTHRPSEVVATGRPPRSYHTPNPYTYGRGRADLRPVTEIDIEKTTLDLTVVASRHMRPR